MRVLSVSSFLPYPPDDATRNRAWNLLGHLGSVADVTLLTWLHDGTHAEHVEQMRQAVSDLVAVSTEPKSRSLPRRLVTRAIATARGIPPFMQERLRTHPVPRISRKFDIAVAEDDGAAWLMPPVECPVVVHRHNIFSKTIEDLRRSNSLGAARYLKWTLELPVWRRFDVQTSQKADVSLVTTPEAGEALRRVLPGHNVHIVQNGVVLPESFIEPSESQEIVFLGTMNYEPNADAVVRFVRRVWPLIRVRIPEASLHVIGRNPLPRVSKLKGNGVVILGEVPDVVDACRKARVGVVPLYAGSGIKTKTLELMALGLPVVAFPVGAEGIAAGPSEGMFVEESEEAFALRVCRLLEDLELARRSGAAARQFVTKRFDWRRTARAYEEILRSVIQECSNQGAP